MSDPTARPMADPTARPIERPMFDPIERPTVQPVAGVTVPAGPPLRGVGTRVGRRALLGGALAGFAGIGVLAACGSGSSGAASAGGTAVPSSQPSSSAAPTSGSLPATASPTGTGEVTPQATTSSVRSALAALETRYGARLGVYALDSGSGTVISYQGTDRFAMCSTYKFLAVALALKKAGTAGLSQQIDYSEADLVDGSPVTGRHTRMSLRALCAAALQYSDNTAANLILKKFGGPSAVTAFSRTLGDHVTRLDRDEPGLNTAVPGDERDTSTPKNLATDLFALVVGSTLSEVGRVQLKEWLLGNTTGARRIRAGVPVSWKVADKTGSGSYGTANDVAILYPPGNKEPIVLAVMSTMKTRGAAYDEKLLAEATAAVIAALPGTAG